MMLDWNSLAVAPADILGKPITLMHWAGATERCTLETKGEAATALMRGWTQYREEKEATDDG